MPSESECDFDGESDSPEDVASSDHHLQPTALIMYSVEVDGFYRPAGYVAPFPQMFPEDPLAPARNASFHRQFYKVYDWCDGPVVQVRTLGSGFRARLMPPEPYGLGFVP